MKTDSKIIIYDDDCPLCAAYTSAFVKMGFLDKNRRKNFGNIDAVTFALIDKKKCNNQIPLIDLNSKQVWYGIDALLEILDQKIPFIKSFGNIKPIKWLLQKFYKFISYNRKVIVATSAKTNSYDCSPDLNIPYRIYFLLFFFIFNTWMLLPLYETVFCKSFISNSSIIQLQAAHLALVCCNIFTALCLTKKTAMEYLGQVNMLALLSILLLLPLHFINKYTGVADTGINNIYMGFTSIIIIKEYFRRMRYAGIIKNYFIIVWIHAVSITAFFIYLIK